MNFSEYSSEDYFRPHKLSSLHRRVFPLNMFNSSSSSNNQALITLPALISNPTTPTKTLKINKKYFNPIQPCEKQQKFPGFPSLDYKRIKNEKNSSKKSRKTSKNFEISCGKSKSLDKKHIFRSIEKKKKKKKNLSEILEEIKPVRRVRRISSSQIHHPALNMGEILEKIKELVLDPLKDEINN
jgi:hypothetical protein